MSKQITPKLKAADTKKVIIVFLLFLMSIAIFLLGSFFSVYSLIEHISFKVLNTNVPGVIFGLAVAYLGFRYFFSVRKLRKEIYTPDAKFSWSNFKKSNVAKSR